MNLYYEFAGEDRNLRGSNSLTLLCVEGIKLAISKGLNFDFDGGMRKSGADFMRRFGADLVPFYRVFKVLDKNVFRKKMLKLHECFK